MQICSSPCKGRGSLTSAHQLVHIMRNFAHQTRDYVKSRVMSVMWKPSISPMERLFVPKTLSHTQWATKVKKFVGIYLKRLCSRVMPRNMSEKANMLIIQTYPMSAFSAWHTAKGQRVPNDCQQHSALPKTMPNDATSPCWSENWQHHEL